MKNTLAIYKLINLYGSLVIDGDQIGNVFS